MRARARGGDECQLTARYVSTQAPQGRSLEKIVLVACGEKLCCEDIKASLGGYTAYFVYTYALHNPG